MTFEDYLCAIPLLHSWDQGKSWNTGGFAGPELRTLHDLVGEAGGARATVLETGAGNSTIAFLFAAPARLVSVCPDEELFARILSFCEANGLSTAPLERHVARSEWLLPTLAQQSAAGGPVVDLVLIDGGHGWPTVFVDFCYANAMLRKGGVIVLDDVQLHSVKELARLLAGQARDFSLVARMPKTLAFRKLTAAPFLPDWGGQPYVVERTRRDAAAGTPYDLS